MSASVQGLRKWVDGRSLRERVFLFAAVLFGVYGLWDVVVLQPLERARAEARAEASRLGERITANQRHIALLSQRLGEDVNAGARKRHADLEAGLANVDGRIREASAALVSPVEMTHLLEDLVAQHPGLTLERLESVPPRAATAEPPARGGEAPPREEEAVLLYRHGLELEFAGRYLDLVDYLTAVEALPWRLFWDDLQVGVDGYPRMRARLKLYTVSLESEWVGG